MRSRLSVLLICLVLLCPIFLPTLAAADGDIYAASYKTYDTTYDDILKMYLRVMPAQCRNQSRRRHDLYNEFMYDDLSPYYMEGIMTPEYDGLDETGKSKKLKDLQEKTLSYMKRTVGYATQDINGDGIDELIIGRNKSYIYELFTIDDGKIRELIKAGYRHPCYMLNDGTLLRSPSSGAGHFGYVLYQMNRTKKVEFVKGYYYNGQLGYEYQLAEDDCWFRITNSKDISANTIDQHVPASEAEQWFSGCEANYANIRFIPFAAYEKGISGDGIAVLSKDGKTTGSQKIRIRKAPDNKSKIIAQKKIGTYVIATAIEGDYYQITVDKKTGYVHKDYIILLTDLPENPEE